MPESNDSKLVLYYAPRTRSFTALWLLEEMGVPYRLEAFDLLAGRHKHPDFLALNPMGKVPLVVDDGTPVSELSAIAIYLGDRFPESKIAPPVGHPHRAAYLRWVVFQSSVMEPAYAERFSKMEPRPTNYAWGSFDQMLAVATAAVQPGPFLLGDMFTAADVLVGSAVRFGILFGVLPKEGALADYLGRVTARDGFARASAIADRINAELPPPQR